MPLLRYIRVKFAQAFCVEVGGRFVCIYNSKVVNTIISGELVLYATHVDENGPLTQL